MLKTCGLICVLAWSLAGSESYRDLVPAMTFDAHITFAGHFGTYSVPNATAAFRWPDSIDVTHQDGVQFINFRFVADDEDQRWYIPIQERAEPEVQVQRDDHNAVSYLRLTWKDSGTTLHMERLPGRQWALRLVCHDAGKGPQGVVFLRTALPDQPGPE